MKTRDNTLRVHNHLGTTISIGDLKIRYVLNSGEMDVAINTSGVHCLLVKPNECIDILEADPDRKRFVNEWLYYQLDYIQEIVYPEGYTAPEFLINGLEFKELAKQAENNKIEEAYVEGWHDGRNTTSVSGYEVDWEDSESKKSLETA